MPPVPVTAVARAMRRADRETLATLFAAAHDARDRETSVEDEVVVVRDPRTGRERRTAVARRPGDVAGDVDAVLTPRPERFPDGTGIDVLGPADLRDLLRYGVDRETGERLADRYLGLPLTVAEPTAPSGPSRSAWLAAALVAVAAVAGVALAVGAGPALTPDGGEPTAADTFTYEPPTSTPTATTTDGDDAYPDWLSASGAVDADALADSHRRLLAGAPYATRLDFDGTRAVGGGVYADATLDVITRNASVYRSRFVGVRRSNDGGRSFDTRRYADGSTEYVKVAGRDVERRPLPNGGEATPFDARTAAFVERYLSGGNVSVSTFQLEGERFYRVTVNDAPGSLGSPAPLGSGDEPFDPSIASATDYTAVAYIRPSGLVNRMRVRYERADGREVSFSLSLEVRESVEVPPPSWYVDYAEATANWTATTDGTATPTRTAAPNATETGDSTATADGTATPTSAPDVGLSPATR